MRTALQQIILEKLVSICIWLNVVVVVVVAQLCFLVVLCIAATAYLTKLFVHSNLLAYNALIEKD
jgi:hypothetical protein